MSEMWTKEQAEKISKTWVKPCCDSSRVEHIVSCATRIVVQMFSEHEKVWGDIRPPQDVVTGVRMPCGTLEDAQAIVLLYEDDPIGGVFNKMRIIKRETTDSLLSS